MADTSDDGQPDDRRPAGLRAGGHVDPRGREDSRRAHPALLLPPGTPVAGVCRMCLVEVEKAPKLAPACATSVAEGQVVHVHSEKALEARKGVLEMLLINHPLDCPICDQSGECELQDYTYQEGRARRRATASRSASTRSRTSAATSCTSPNRCILCTRCVRFMDDVAHDPVLNVSERGDRALHRQVRGQGPHAPVGRQRRRPLPGRRAALQGLPEQGARVGARPHGVGLPELLAGLQHDRRDARQRRSCGCARARTTTSTSTSCATTAA